MGLRAFLLLALVSATRQRQHTAESRGISLAEALTVHSKAQEHFLSKEDPNMPGVEGKTRPADGLPEQGFKGMKVTHTNTKSATSYFAAEYGPGVDPKTSSAMVAAALAFLAVNA